MSNRIRATALIVALTLMLSLTVLSAGDEGANMNETNSKPSALSIPSWSSYMKCFNKKYSSLSQQLIRQKLFIARAIEVFATRIKYKLMQLSYYTVINEYSDATPDEGRRLLSGDVDIEKEPPMDDGEAEILLLEALSERNSNENLGRGGTSYWRRTKRSNDEAPSYTQDQPPKIRWRIQSNNPDYEPLQVSSNDVKNVHEKKVAQDISPDRAAEIEIGLEENRHKLAEIASGGYGRMRNVIGGAIGWLSPGQSGSGREEADSADGVDGKKRATEIIVDWRESGCIGPVRNQGDCLSCYAISAMGFMEWALCKANDGQLTQLSVQYMVSCGPQYKNETRGRIRLEGCNQGASRQTVDFIREYGVELEANMPYLQQDTPCPLKPHTTRNKKGYIRPNAKAAIRLKSKTKQLDLALKTGPVMVGMWEPRDFLAYGGGVIRHCDQQGGHAMLIVGAVIEDGKEYLIIKNSFGPRWGMDGYFKFDKSSIEECVKEFIIPRIYFPGKKAQARRIKAYIADQQTDLNDSIREFDNIELDSSILKETMLQE